MAWLNVGIAAVTVISGVAQGRSAKKSAEGQAEQMGLNADRRLVEGEMDAAEIRRQTRILLGDARAAMASSGGTTTGAQALRQLGDIEESSRFNELSALYEARMDSDSMWRGAGAVERSGRFAARSAYVSTVGSVLSSGAAQTLWGKGVSTLGGSTRVTSASAPVVSSTPTWTRGT